MRRSPTKPQTVWRAVICRLTGIVPLLLAGAVFLPAAPAAGEQDPGVRLGYFKNPDAAHASASVGLYGRIDLPGPVNLELSVEFRKEELADGNLEAGTMPFQATALFFPVPAWFLRPYLLGGVGFYYTRLRLRRPFTELREEESHLLGFHAGIGLEFPLVGVGALSADFRYLVTEGFLSPAVEDVLGKEYRPGGLMVSVGLGIFF